MKLAVPDLISPSYFPAIAAVELGCLAERGVDAELSLRYPVTSAVEDLRAGKIDLLAGSAHAMFHDAPDGGGVRLLAALSRNTYWFLVVRADLGLQPGIPLTALAGLRIGAAPGPRDALVQLLRAVGPGPDEVDIVSVPGASADDVSFGVTAARALGAGQIDGFWANGMGAEVAVRNGSGTVIVDARRGSSPPGLQGYTFAALMTTTALAQERPADVRAVVAGLVDAQQRLRREPELAKGAAERLFPPMEADLIVTLISRDAPFYDPAISNDAVAEMVGFAGSVGLAKTGLAFGDVVLTEFDSEWSLDTEGAKT